MPDLFVYKMKRVQIFDIIEPFQSNVKHSTYYVSMPVGCHNSQRRDFFKLSFCAMRVKLQLPPLSAKALEQNTRSELRAIVFVEEAKLSIVA